MADDYSPPRPEEAIVDDHSPPRPEEAVSAPTPMAEQSPVTLGAGSTGAMHFARHLAFGLGDKITAAIEALEEKHYDKTGKTTFSDAYNRNLKFNDALLDASDKAHPVARWVGNGLGVVGNAAALAGVAPARAALAARGLVPAAAESVVPGTVLGRALSGLKEGSKVGSVLGGVGGYGASRADNPLLDIGLGTIGGGVLGGALGTLGGTLGGYLNKRALPQPAIKQALAEQEHVPAIAQKLGVAPSEDAQVLQRHGVSLPLWKMRPGDAASVVGEAVKRVPFLDEQAKGLEEQALEQWRNAALNEARSPVEGPLRPGGTMEKLHGLAQDFRQAYGQIADKPVPMGAIHPDTGKLVNPVDAFGAILKDPHYQANPSDLSVVSNVFEDELGKLHQQTEGGKSITAGLLMGIRSNLREAAQKARLSNNFNTADMFQDAADSIGGGIRSGLAGPDAELLSRTDSAYSKFMRVADAAWRARQNAEEGEFGPKQLSQSLAQAYGKKFATDPNKGGALRELARSGKAIFTDRNPMTGHGDTLKSGVGAALGPAMLAASSNPQGQAAFMLAAQNAAGRAASPMVGPAGLALSSAATKTPGGILPAELANQLAQAAALRR